MKKRWVVFVVEWKTFTATPAGNFPATDNRQRPEFTSSFYPRVQMSGCHSNLLILLQMSDREVPLRWVHQGDNSGEDLLQINQLKGYSFMDGENTYFAQKVMLSNPYISIHFKSGCCWDNILMLHCVVRTQLRSLYRSKNQNSGSSSRRGDRGKGVKRAEKGAERPPRERGSN